MKLEGLRIYKSYLLRELDVEDLEVYYFYNVRWYEISNQKQCAEIEVSNLQRAKSEPIAHHSTNELNAWFYISEAQAAVRLEFSKSPRVSIRRRYCEAILRIRESALNAYKVSHNPLTQLLARDAFREVLAAAISNIQSLEESKAAAVDSGAPRSLTVLALDIDHFKQVNDNWGHLYGDQCLRHFLGGWRHVLIS